MLKKIDLETNPLKRTRLLPTTEALRSAVWKKLRPLADKPPLSDALATHDYIKLSLDDSGRLQVEFSETTTSTERPTSFTKEK